MRVEQRTTIAAPRERVWEVISDPRRYQEFMQGLVVADVLSTNVTGCGARWGVRLLVGAAALGGTVEVVEYDEPADLAWNAVTGLGLRGRWRLRERRPGRTDATFRLAYQVPGGVTGLLAERVAAPVVRRRLKHSLRRLRVLVEEESAGPRHQV